MNILVSVSKSPALHSKFILKVKGKGSMETYWVGNIHVSETEEQLSLQKSKRVSIQGDLASPALSLGNEP